MTIASDEPFCKERVLLEVCSVSVVTLCPFFRRPAAPISEGRVCHRNITRNSFGQAIGQVVHADGEGRVTMPENVAGCPVAALGWCLVAPCGNRLLATDQVADDECYRAFVLLVLDKEWADHVLKVAAALIGNEVGYGELFQSCYIEPTSDEPAPVQWLQQAAALALSLGARRGELMNLALPDIDLQRGHVELRRTKNGKSRSVPINELARMVFDAMGVPERKNKRDRGLLFTDFTPEQLSMRFIRACRDAGIEDFSLHSLRHTYASWLRMTGADLGEIKELLGHSDLRMTLRYAHLKQEHLVEAASRLNGVFSLPAPAPEGAEQATEGESA
jgi:integrase/recombinase XerD